MHRRKIVAISGSGRTGSTLLSLLLSQHKDVFNLGQLRDLWGAWANDAPCTCDHPLGACPIYSKVAPSTVGAQGDPGVAQMKADMQAFFADADYLPDWSDLAATSKLAADHASVLARLTGVLDALQAKTGAKTFIDSSKSPEMALALSLTEGSDVRVLNLARDPRAVAVSWQLKRGFGAGLKYSRVWARRQQVLERWSRALGERFLTVRYEDLAGAPEATIGMIQAWADLPATKGLFTAPGRATIDWSGQHLYPPANERVLAERKTEVVIAPSEGWRGRGHALMRSLAMIWSHPQGAAYVRGG